MISIRSFFTLALALTCVAIKQGPCRAMSAFDLPRKDSAEKGLWIGRVETVDWREGKWY
jgi:hypothetical protein